MRQKVRRSGLPCHNDSHVLLKTDTFSASLRKKSGGKVVEKRLSTNKQNQIEN